MDSLNHKCRQLSIDKEGLNDRDGREAVIGQLHESQPAILLQPNETWHRPIPWRSPIGRGPAVPSVPYLS